MICIHKTLVQDFLSLGKSLSPRPTACGLPHSTGNASPNASPTTPRRSWPVNPSRSSRGILQLRVRHLNRCWPTSASPQRISKTAESPFERDGFRNLREINQWVAIPLFSKNRLITVLLIRPGRIVAMPVQENRETGSRKLDRPVANQAGISQQKVKGRTRDRPMPCSGVKLVRLPSPAFLPDHFFCRIKVKIRNVASKRIAFRFTSKQVMEIASHRLLFRES